MSTRPTAAQAAEELLPYLTRTFARTRARGWVAIPGTGLTLDLPHRLLVEGFGLQHVMRFEDVDFPPALVHEPTRRFLREVGLPDNAFPFHLDTELPLPTLGEFHAEDPDRVHQERLRTRTLPDAADSLIRLGRLGATDLTADAVTGALAVWSPADGTLTPLHADTSTLAFALWLRELEAVTAVA